jgi:hypothetical protein
MRRRLVVAGLALLMLFAGSSSCLIRQGFTHVMPASMLRWSLQKWNQGQHAESIGWFFAAHETALNAGLRWAIAGLYLDRTARFESQGELKAALASCADAVRILDGYDDEGGVSYHCTALEGAATRAP